MCVHASLHHQRYNCTDEELHSQGRRLFLSRRERTHDESSSHNTWSWSEISWLSGHSRHVLSHAHIHLTSVSSLVYKPWNRETTSAKNPLRYWSLYTPLVVSWEEGWATSSRWCKVMDEPKSRLLWLTTHFLGQWPVWLNQFIQSEVLANRWLC